MQHLEDGFLHEIADGEVPSEELVLVREHLEACESCRARLDEARHEAETARELIELIEVPVGSTVRRADGPAGGRADRRAGGQWIKPLAWAASLALAAGIGYYGRGSAPFSAPRAELTSLGRIDTVYVDIPAQPAAPGESAEADRVSSNERAAGVTAQSPRLEAAPPPARQNAAGARAQEEQSSKRRAGLDTSLRADELVVKTAEKKAESKDDNARLQESFRERPVTDARDQTAQRLARNAPQPAAPSVAGATAESRLMAKSAADGAPTIISFPRAVELLGGRIKLIEGMVPARLEAVGRTVRVLYLIDEGDLVLAQVAATDSLNWSLSGPLSADSLAALRKRIR